MANQLVSCPHCGGSGWAKGPSIGRRGRSGSTRTQTFETTAAALPFSSGSFSPIEQGLSPEFEGILSPGEKRSSTLYHQWSRDDVWVSGLLALGSGIAVGLPGTFICIALNTKWIWPLLTWTLPPAIVWGLRVKDIFKDDKAVISNQEQERRADPTPINVEGPSADIVINSGTVQKRAKLWAPKTNHAGLWQYADALVRETAAPSYEGGEHVTGAKAYGYTPAEFDGRSDCWRPTAIAGGILEKDPEKSRGYRLTDPGRRALAVVTEQRLGEWG